MENRRRKLAAASSGDCGRSRILAGVPAGLIKTFAASVLEKPASWVAQHCVLVERLVRANAPKLDQKWCLATLLHDAPEYVIGDMITPFKHVLGGIYRDIESGLDRAVNIRFGLPPSLPETVERSIKRADRMAAWLEATQLAGFSKTEAAKVFIKPAGTPANIRLRPQSPDDAAASFLRRFSILGGYKKQMK